MSALFERYAPTIRTAFGDGTEPIAVVAKRAVELLPGESVIVWEGDPQTFQFSFVSASAESILGYPLERWTKEPTFWADHVVHPEDRDDAIAYCALATGKALDHAFEYRAVAKDGRTVTLVDYVQVVVGTKLVAQRLRGIMIDVTTLVAEKASPARWQEPNRRDLEAARPT